jgi:hypothetical protein
MANMTWLELSKALRREAGVQGDGPTAVTSQTGIYANIVEWVNQAWVEVQGMHHNWRFMYGTDSFTTVTQTAEYNELPADFYSIQPSSVFATAGTARSPVRFLEWSQFRSRYLLSILKDDRIPSVMTIRPDKIIAFSEYTLPDYDIAFEYAKSPTPFTLSSSATTWPEQFDMLIVFKALIDYGMFYNAPESVEHGKMRYIDYLTRLKESQLVYPRVQIGQFTGHRLYSNSRFI